MNKINLCIKLNWVLKWTQPHIIRNKYNNKSLKMLGYKLMYTSTLLEGS